VSNKIEVVFNPQLALQYTELFPTQLIP